MAQRAGLVWQHGQSEARSHNAALPCIQLSSPPNPYEALKRQWNAISSDNSTFSKPLAELLFYFHTKNCSHFFK